MLLYELFERGPVPAGIDDFQPRVSGTNVRVASFVVPEQQALMQKLGVMDTVIPVMHVYQEEMSDNIDRQDYLKMRRPEFQTPEHRHTLEELIGKSLQAALKYDERFDKGKRQETRIGTRHVTTALSNNAKYNFVVVPIPSSSELSGMIAAKAAALMKTQVVPALQKNEQVKFSTQSAGNYNSNVVDPTDPKPWEERAAQIQAELEKFKEPLTPQQRQQEAKLYKEWEAAEAKAERARNFKHSQKSHMRSSKYNYGKAFYGKFASTEAAKALNGKPVMLIDDNVASGKTFAEAALALFEAGIVPSKIFGFVLHKFGE